MKREVFSILIAICALSTANMLSAVAGELEGMTNEQKISRIGEVGRDPSDARRVLVYSEGLRDSDARIRALSAGMAGWWLSGIEKRATGTYPSDEEVREFKMGLQRALTDQEPAGRLGACIALAYLAPPTQDTESMLLTAIRAEKEPQKRIEMVEAMASAGYKNAGLIEEALAMFRSDQRIGQWSRAASTLGILQSPSAVAELAAVARVNGERQHLAIQALIAYGPDSTHAVQSLKFISDDPTVDDEARKYAREGLLSFASNSRPSRKNPLYISRFWSPDAVTGERVSLAGTVGSAGPSAAQGNHLVPDAPAVASSNSAMTEPRNQYLVWTVVTLGGLALVIMIQRMARSSK